MGSEDTSPRGVLLTMDAASCIRVENSSLDKGDWPRREIDISKMLFIDHIFLSQTPAKWLAPGVKNFHVVATPDEKSSEGYNNS